MTRSWNILDWNIRGINSQEIWDDIREKIHESNCNIICLQETKREQFDLSYLKNFCPRRFNQFANTPSIGSSGRIITIWNATTLMAL
jgi:exonuclease III